MYSLATLMKQNGHDFIDILKVCFFPPFAFRSGRLIPR
jgi:hypothetical protein